jgi:hypothetical protein
VIRSFALLSLIQPALYKSTSSINSRNSATLRAILYILDVSCQEVSQKVFGYKNDAERKLLTAPRETQGHHV